jgi:CBS domain-containing protein
MAKIPQVKHVMTPFPHSIGEDESIGAAIEMMDTHDIRHLPVTRGHDIVGIISDTDLQVARALWGERPEDATTRIGLICTRMPYTVDLSEPLDRVVLEMAERQVGSVVVLKEERLAGILTTTDVCRLLAEYLHPTPPEDDEVA